MFMQAQNRQALVNNLIDLKGSVDRCPSPKFRHMGSGLKKEKFNRQAKIDGENAIL